MADVLSWPGVARVQRTQVNACCVSPRSSMSDSTSNGRTVTQYACTFCVNPKKPAGYKSNPFPPEMASHILDSKQFTSS